MAKCPWCGTTIAKFFLDRKCPKCGEQLGASDVGRGTLNTVDADSPEIAQEATEPEQENREDSKRFGDTVDSEVMAPEPPKAKNAGSDSLLTIEVPPLPPSVPPVGSSSVSSSSASPKPGIDTLPSVTADVNPNAGEGSSAATIDESSLEPRGAEATLDIAVPAGSDSASKLSQETLDVGQGPSSSGSPFKTDEIRKIWERAAGSSGDPAHSLAKGPVQVSDSVFERISTRNLNLNPNVKTANADYHIKAELGRGKQGIVYAAQQKGLDRTVAIKLVRKDKSSSSEREKLNRFVREAEITASLDHPNILPIHEIAVTSEGELFYSMKRVQGKSWDDILDEKKETLDESVEHLLKVCDAIAFAHSKGIIHRDLKPGNVMIGGFGEVLVADWGMAVDVSNNANFKPTDEKREPFSFGGTPAYMSPEMAKHDWRKIGPASDIYLLGAILYHLIEGKPPRDGRTVFDVLEGAKNNSVIKPKETGGLMAVALKAMSASTTDRYKTATEMQDAIREVNRHAESMRLANRSAKLLEEAIAESDYEKFNGAIFGYRDAINLWRDNKAAEVGVNKARMAYAENAFSRGDFDVCLDALDPENPAEKELYSKAEKAQAEAKNRERRYRSLRRYSAIGAVVALGGLSLLTLRLQTTNGKLEVQTGLAQTEAANAREAEKKAKEEAENARNAEATAKNERIKADDAKSLAIKEAANAREAEKIARSEEMKAKAAAEAEKMAKEIANQKTLEAIRNERIATLGSYQARLLSAYSLAESLSIGRSNALLAEVEQLQNRLQQKPDIAAQVNAEAAKVKWASPPLKTWPFGRVAMMNNQDVPQLDWGRDTGCIDVAASAPIAVVGSKQGKQSQLQLIAMEPGSLSEVADKSLTVDRDVLSVAISPDGKEVVYIPRGSNTPQPGLFYWDTATKEALPFPELKNREFRWVAFSPDGKHLLVGINNGVYRWKRDSALNINDSNPIIYASRGALLNIQFVETEGETKKAICTSVINATVAGQQILLCYELDLDSNTSTVLKIPEELETIATTATVVDEQGNLLVGTSDGRLLQLVRGEKSGQLVDLKVTGELLPRVHQTKIRAIRPYKTSQLLTVAQDNAVQLWKAISSGGERRGWQHVRALAGLTDIAVDGKFVGDGKHVLAVDQSGRIVDWDLGQQALRSGMQSPESSSGMVAVGGSGSAGPNWWMDRAGILSLWGGERDNGIFNGNFPGHTPEAEFADAIYSPQSGRVVTATRLGDYSKPYRSELESQNEICVWDAATGVMLNRWRLPSENIPRVGFIADGNKIVVISGSSVFVSNLDGSERFDILDEGKAIEANHVLPHPIKPSQFALLGDRGNIWMVNFEGASPQVVKNDSWAFKTVVRLLKGSWNQDGSRLYLLRNQATDADPALVSLDWNGTEFLNPKKVANFDKLDILSQFAISDDKIKANTYITDLMTKSEAPGIEQIHFVIRYPFRPKGKNQIANALSGIVTSNLSGGGDSLLTLKDHEKRVWLNERYEIVEGESIAEKLGFGRSTFSKLIPIGKDSYMGVVNLESDKADPLTRFIPFAMLATEDPSRNSLRLFGRTTTIAGSADTEANTFVTVHDQGEIWLGKRTEGNRILWRQLDLDSSVANIAAKPSYARLSPDGKHLLVSHRAGNEYSVALIDVEGSKKLGEWKAMQYASWQPTGAAFAVADSQGNAKIIQRSDLAEKAFKLNASAGEQSDVRRIEWFQEVLSDENRKQSKWYLLAQHGLKNLTFHDPEAGEPIGDGKAFSDIKMDSNITSVACSPVDNTIAVGTQSGNLTTWFASPSIDERARELFSIGAHRGSVVKDLRFASDGITLFSADAPETLQGRINRGRAYGWLSLKLEEDEKPEVAGK
jgi:WD40 repeat protein/tRNA A-37 threonylcarbamoyl transferase component Bud32